MSSFGEAVGGMIKGFESALSRLVYIVIFLIITILGLLGVIGYLLWS